MAHHPFPFIVGCGRSGTTLLRAMLDAHPDVAIPGESYFPVWLSRPANRYGPPGQFDFRRFAQDLGGHNYFAHWQLPADQVLAALERARPDNFADAVRSVYALYGSVRGKSRYADKTPVFVLHIDRLAQLFPEAVFVHLVRDGRDVALSILDVGWGPTTLDQAAMYWRHQVRHGLEAGDRVGPRCLSVTYEDLVAAPRAELTKICSFIGIDFSESMLSYSRGASSLLAGLPNPGEHDRLVAPPSARRDWRTSLSAEDAAVFDLLAGDVLTRAGYALSSGGPPSPAASSAARKRASRARVEWRAASARRALRRSAWRARHLVDARLG